MSSLVPITSAPAAFWKRRLRHTAARPATRAILPRLRAAQPRSRQGWPRPKLAGGGGDPMVPDLWAAARLGPLACQAVAEAWREQIRSAYRVKRNALDTAGNICGCQTC